MDLSPSRRAVELVEAVREFIADEVIPVEETWHRRQQVTRQQWAERGPGAEANPWQVPEELQTLQRAARSRGLWNLFLASWYEGPYAERYSTRGGAGLATSTMRRSPRQWVGRSGLRDVFNCNVPDPGNAEVLLRYGSDEQNARWLDPLLAVTFIQPCDDRARCGLLGRNQHGVDRGRRRR